MTRKNLKVRLKTTENLWIRVPCTVEEFADFYIDTCVTDIDELHRKIFYFCVKLADVETFFIQRALKQGGSISSPYNVFFKVSFLYAYATRETVGFKNLSWIEFVIYWISNKKEWLFSFNCTYGGHPVLAMSIALSSLAFHICRHALNNSRIIILPDVTPKLSQNTI